MTPFPEIDWAIFTWAWHEGAEDCSAGYKATILAHKNKGALFAI